MQLNCLVFDEVADVSVHLSEDKRDIITKAHLSASNGFNGGRATLVVICEETSSIFIEFCFDEVYDKDKDAFKTFLVSNGCATFELRKYLDTCAKHPYIATVPAEWSRWPASRRSPSEGRVSTSKRRSTRESSRWSPPQIRGRPWK